MEPENTIPSFERAATLGAWGAECDIYVLKDGNIVIFHDQDIKRMTNGVGIIKNMTITEVKALRIDNGNNLDKYKFVFVRVAFVMIFGYLLAKTVVFDSLLPFGVSLVCALPVQYIFAGLVIIIINSCTPINDALIFDSFLIYDTVK